MSEQNIILDGIALMIREQRVAIKHSNDELVDKVFKTIEENGDKDTFSGLSLTSALLNYAKELLLRKGEGEKLVINNIIRYVVMEVKKYDNGDDLDLQTIIKSSLTPEGDDDSILKAIQSLTTRLYNYHINQELKGIARFINIKLSKSRNSHILSTVRTKIEELESSATVKDDAILNEIIFNKQELTENADKLFDTIKDKTIYKTGYSFFNEASQGGLRTGETSVIGALSHHNKTGMAIGLTAGVLLMNKFKKKKKRIPLVLHLSYEDPEHTVIIKYYDLLRISLDGKVDDIKPSIEEMALYLESHFSKSGATFMVTHVNPTKWGFRDMFSYLNRLEAMGYYFIMINNDYLDKLGSDGLDKSGPIGADKRELLRRVRNDMIKRDCIYLTPWQLNSRANELITNGLSPFEFPKFVSGKSMYQGNGTLDTDIDHEISIAKCELDNRTYQAIQIGKHRIPTVINDTKKYGIYQFPLEGPIPLDALQGKKSFKRKAHDFGSADTEDSLF